MCEVDLPFFFGKALVGSGNALHIFCSAGPGGPTLLSREAGQAQNFVVKTIFEVK